jgi:hypothetical protein
MDIQEKGLHHMWQAQSRGICKCLLDFFKDFLLLPPPYQRLPLSPFCSFIEWFGPEGVVRDPDSAETCSSQKLSNLPAGFRGWNGTYSLFLLRAEPALFMAQVKAEVFDSVSANLGLFLRDFVSCFP